MKRQHGLLIGERTAEQIKIEIGSAAPLDEQRQMEVRGRHIARGHAQERDGEGRRDSRSAARAPWT